MILNEQREQLLRQHREIMEARSKLTAEIKTAKRKAAAYGHYLPPGELARLENSAAAMLRDADKILQQARQLPKYEGDDPVRMYYHLCRAVRAAFGEQVAEQLILDAKTLLKAQKDEEWEEVVRNAPTT
jgi:hypothetical protein